MRKHICGTLLLPVLAVLAVVTVLAASPSPAWADDDSPKPETAELGIFNGGFISNDSHQFFDYGKFPTGVVSHLNRVDPQFGIRGAYFPSKYIGAELEGSLIAAGLTSSSGNVRIWGAEAQVIFQLPGRITPFATLGWGFEGSTSQALGNDTDFPIHAGLGVRFFWTHDFALRADIRYVRGPSAEAPYTLNTGYGEFNIGASWVIGHKASAAPLPPPPPPVHEVVQPPKDTDGDGFLDDVDKCPTEPETVNGYQDSDGCPDTAPDTDGDGINDILDKCPNEPEDKDGFEDADGCPDPDNDNDGVLDAADRCPLVAGPVENLGCPDTDTDGDGIVDRLDNCPNEKGTAANHGCKAKQLVVITKDQLQILDQVRFATGTAKLSAASYPLLENIVRVMVDHPAITKLKIEGNTDNVGKPAFNQTLSEKRAKSVMDFLVKRGVAADRLDSVGHGESSPIGDNKTAAGRAQNRRVEFNIVGYEPGAPAAAPAAAPATK